MIVLLQINYSKYQSEIDFPLGILSVGSALKKAGFEVKLFNITENNINETVDEIITLSPEFLGVSVMTGIQTKHSAEFCQKIKKKKNNLTIVWGGIHPSLLPEQCLQESYIEYVVIGEGEITIIEFIRRLRAVLLIAPFVIIRFLIGVVGELGQLMQWLKILIF